MTIGITLSFQSFSQTRDNDNLKKTGAVIKETEKLIFSENFSDESRKQLWGQNSGTNNISEYNDPVVGKVLKISCKRPNGDSFLQIFIPEIVNGKNIKISGTIKLQDVIVGPNVRTDKGQLCLEYTVQGITFYEAVQNLLGTSDWDVYYARNDGRYTQNDTEFGDYVFSVPENAKNVRLYLGLQNCTGTIYFKDVSIFEVL